MTALAARIWDRVWVNGAEMGGLLVETEVRDGMSWCCVALDRPIPELDQELWFPAGAVRVVARAKA